MELNPETEAAARAVFAHDDFDETWDETWEGLTETERGYYRVAAKAVFAVVAPLIRARERTVVAEEIAYRIRAELVCCDVYDRDQGTDRAGRTHSICFWGEAGARLAEAHSTVVMSDPRNHEP